MILSSAVLGIDADVENAGVLSAEIIREDVQFAHRLQRWLASRLLTKDAAAVALAIEREAETVALGANSLECGKELGRPAVTVALRDAGIDVEKSIDVAAVPRQVNHRRGVERLAQGGIFCVDPDRLRRDLDVDSLLCRVKHGVLLRNVGTIQNDSIDDAGLESWGRKRSLVLSRNQIGRIVFAPRVGFEGVNPEIA